MTTAKVTQAAALVLGKETADPNPVKITQAGVMVLGKETEDPNPVKITQVSVMVLAHEIRFPVSPSSGRRIQNVNLF